MDKDVITVTSPLLPDLEEFNKMLRQIWDNKWMTNNGTFHQQLEKALCEYLKVPYISLFTNVSFDIRIPYGSFFTVGGAALMISLGVFAIPAQIVIMCGTVNGSNFTDGLDGLAASVTAVIALFMAIASSVTSAGIAPAAMSFLGGLLGFLVYNHHPAKVFMGDTGSLSLGGFVAAGFIMMNMPLYLIIAAFIYFAEVLSVIIQVLYFKSTGGKRFFRMAPIHHHFELSGWSEVKVVAVFSIVTVMLCALALTAI